MKSSNQKYINQIPKRILISTLTFTFGFIFLILIPTVSSHLTAPTKLSSAQITGAYINGAIIVAVSLIWLAFNTYYVQKQIKPFERKTLLLIMMWTPLAGVIVNFILIRQEKRNSNNHSKTNTSKEPMPVQILLVILTIVVVLVIWIVYITMGNRQHSVYDPQTGKTIQVDNTIPGIFDIFLSPIKGFIDSAEIIVYLLIMGAFLQVVNTSKALEAGIGKLVKKLRGKELIIIPIFMLLFSIGGATFGMCEETIPFYAIVMPIVLAAGFDGITGVIIILFGAGLGVCASIVNPFMIMTAVDAVNKQGFLPTPLSTGDGIVFRVIIYFVFLAIGITFTMLYANKVRKNPKKSYVYDLRNVHSQTFKFDHSVVPEFTLKRKVTLIIFTLCFVLLIIGAIPWSDITGWNGFNWLDNWLTTNFPFIATGVGAIGSWYLASFALLFLVGTIIMATLNWTNVNDFYKNIVIGAKEFLSISFVIAVARGLSLILTDSGLAEMIANGASHALSINSILGVVILFLAFVLISIFIPSTSGFAYTIYGPLAAPAMFNASIPYSISGGIASSSMANGLVNLASPTAGPFVIGCAMAKVPLKYFYKSAWKLLAILLGTAIVLLIIGTLLPQSIVGK